MARPEFETEPCPICGDDGPHSHLSDGPFEIDSFKMTPQQKAFYENPGRFRVFDGGKRYGRTAEKIAHLRAMAVSEHEAELAIDDLKTKGYALMKDGKRYVPPPSKLPKITFYETKR